MQKTAIDVVDDIDYLEDTSSCNNINNKNNLDNTINENKSVTFSEEYSFRDSEVENEHKPQSSKSEENHIPIIGKDFSPKEELVVESQPNDGKTFWKLKNEVTSNFIKRMMFIKWLEVYNL